MRHMWILTLAAALGWLTSPSFAQVNADADADAATQSQSGSSDTDQATAGDLQAGASSGAATQQQTPPLPDEVDNAQNFQNQTQANQTTDRQANQASGAAATAQQGNAQGNMAAQGNRLPAERWRYRRHNGEWWYWSPRERWLFWRDGSWHVYDQNTYRAPGAFYQQPQQYGTVYDDTDRYVGPRYYNTPGTYSYGYTYDPNYGWYPGGQRYSTGYRGYNAPYNTWGYGGYYGPNAGWGYGPYGNGYGAGAWGDNRYFTNPGYRTGANIGGAIGGAIGGRAGAGIGSAIGGEIGE